MKKGSLSKIQWHPLTKGLQCPQILGKSIIALSLSLCEAFLRLQSIWYLFLCTLLFPKHVPFSFMEVLSSNYSKLSAENFQSSYLSLSMIVYVKMTQRSFLSFQLVSSWF